MNLRPTHTHLLRATLALLLALGATGARAQERAYADGEVLGYQVSLGKFGRQGLGWLRVEPSAPVRGEPAVRLSFDFSTRVGPFQVQHHSRSWLSTQRFAALRYELEERAPLNDRHDRVDIFPDQQRWAGVGGSGPSPSAEPLDELSFLYALRGLELVPGTVLQAERHYDLRRGAVIVRVLRREPVRVPAGVFSTVLVEMEVKDPQRYGGRGVLRLNLTDDEHRVPVRIESQVPMVGALVLELQSSEPLVPPTET